MAPPGYPPRDRKAKLHIDHRQCIDGGIGHADFPVADPPLKLELFENPRSRGTLHHLGLDRDSMEEVEEQATRLEAAGLPLDTEGGAVCC